ncbi:MAG: hypothetical protein QM820_55805 [Minicystis sp.]
MHTSAAPVKTRFQGWLSRAPWTQKALVILTCPLAASIYVIFFDPIPGPAPPAPAGSVSAPLTSVSSTPPTDPIAVPTTHLPDKAAKPSAPTSRSTDDKRTLQRRAADAVADGAFEEAARLYEELARAEPKVPAYAEAARILRTRAQKR